MQKYPMVSLIKCISEHGDKLLLGRINSSADCFLDNVTKCTSQRLSGCVSNAGLGISPALQLESDFIVSWIISLFRRCRSTSSQIHWTQSQRVKAKLMSSKEFISQPRSSKHTSIYIKVLISSRKRTTGCHENICITPSGRFLIAVEKRQLFVIVLYCGLFVFHYTHTAQLSYLSGIPLYVLLRCCLAQLRSWMKVF